MNQWHGIRVTKWNKRRLTLRQRLTLVLLVFFSLFILLFIMPKLTPQNPQLSGCESSIFNAVLEFR
jgi:hypothetical protein